MTGKVMVVVSALVLGVGCHDRGAPSAAKVSVVEREATITLGEQHRQLPLTDFGKELPAVVRDAESRRLAYRTDSGSTRIVYRVGDGLFVGPLVASPLDFRAVPDLEHAFGPLYESAGKSRSALVHLVGKDLGSDALVQLLVAASYVDDPYWEQTVARLTPDERRALGDGLARGLEPSKPALMLRRAVRYVDLDVPARRRLVVARAADASAWEAEPASASALLRSVIASSPKEATKIACDLLAHIPESQIGASSKLIETALLALLATDSDCPGVRVAEKVLAAEPCLPYYRCNDVGPISWSTASDQTEPLCSRDQVDADVASELRRSKVETLDAQASRAGLFAYAFALRRGRITPDFERAHARRRFAITQVAEPPCAVSVPAGSPCHCSETAIRARACASGDAKASSSGYCGFDVDDGERTTRNVVRATPR